jgi:hypothetical protein
MFFDLGKVAGNVQLVAVEKSNIISVTISIRCFRVKAVSKISSTSSETCVEGCSSYRCRFLFKGAAARRVRVVLVWAPVIPNAIARMHLLKRPASCGHALRVSRNLLRLDNTLGTSHFRYPPSLWTARAEMSTLYLLLFNAKIARSKYNIRWKSFSVIKGSFLKITGALVIPVSKKPCFNWSASLISRIRYIPRTAAEQPSLLRLTAYAEGTPLPPPEFDPQGYKLHISPRLTARVFSTWTVEVECSV